MKSLSLLLLLFLTISCGGNKSNEANVPNDQAAALSLPDSTTNLAIPNNTLSQEYTVLLIGNSHVASNNLPEIIKQLIETGKPKSEVNVERSEGFGYLADKVNDGITLEKITSETWSHVILQAQKYSQSGSVHYPTTAAESWVSAVKNVNATPILFPEHPQLNNPEEARYVHNIHFSIAQKQQSCVAPVGLGWDIVLATLPDLALHSADGNHAGYAGSYFTALIFYQVITNELADALPFMDTIPLSDLVQDQLGKIASQTLEQHQACDY